MHTKMTGLMIEDHICKGVKVQSYHGALETLTADDVILTTGGLAYPSTGSTGDGHRLLKQAGVALEPCYPALVPVETVGRSGQSDCRDYRFAMCRCAWNVDRIKYTRNREKCCLRILV